MAGEAEEFRGSGEVVEGNMGKRASRRGNNPSRLGSRGDSWRFSLRILAVCFIVLLGCGFWAVHDLTGEVISFLAAFILFVVAMFRS